MMKKNVYKQLYMWLFLCVFYTFLIIDSGFAASNDSRYHDKAMKLINQQTATVSQLKNQLQHSPDHAGIILDLAIAYCQRTDFLEMQHVLQRLESNFVIHAGIQYVIDLLYEHRCKRFSYMIQVPKNNAPHWSIEVFSAVSDNINQGTSVEQIPINIKGKTIELELNKNSRAIADSSLGVTLSTQYALNKQWNMRAVHHQQRYKQYVENNVQYNAVGFNYKVSPQIQANFYTSHLRLDNKTWLQNKGIGLTGVRAQSFGEERFHFNIDQANYPLKEQFNAVRAEVGFTQTIKINPQLAISGTLKLSKDKPHNNRPGGERTAYLLDSKVQYALNNDILVYAKQQYGRTKETDAYNTTLFANQKRDSRKNRQSLGIEWQLDKKNKLNIEYEAVKMSDEIQLFNYTKDTFKFAYRYTW